MKMSRASLVTAAAVTVMLAGGDRLPRAFQVGQSRVSARQFPGGGFGGPQQPQALVERFDKDGDKRLNSVERRAAREFVESTGRGRPGRGGRGFGQDAGPPAKGPAVTKASVKPV